VPETKANGQCANNSQVTANKSLKCMLLEETETLC